MTTSEELQPASGPPAGWAARLLAAARVASDNGELWLPGALATMSSIGWLPFVLAGAPLFKVFPQFGALLLGADEPRWLVHALGWTYHLSNAVALGIMFLALVSFFRRPSLFWGAVVWALFVELMLLLTPYANFFGLKLDARFLFLTLTAHLVFGIALGLYCRRRLTLSQPSATM